MGGAGHLPVRPDEVARRGLLDRHAASHRERLPARRARLLVHPHRLHRPLQAHERLRGLLPDGLGRQRPADRAACPELLRRALRPEPALRPCLRAARRTRREASGSHLAQELRRAVRAAHRRGRGRLRGALASHGAVDRLVADVPDHRCQRPACQPAGVPPQPRPGRGLPVGGAHPVGRHLPHRGGAGRARGPRAARGVPPHRLRNDDEPRREGLHRDNPPRAARGVRGARRAPGRRALPAALRHDRHHAGLRRRRACGRAHARGSREGLGHRHDLHLRRSHRRHLVARAAAAHAADHRVGRPDPAGRARVGGHRCRARELCPHRRRDEPHGQGADGRDPHDVRRPGRRAQAHHAPRQVLREGRQAPRDRDHPPVVHHQRRP